MNSAYAFHVSRRARDRYRFDQQIFTFNGNAIFPNFHAARVFAQKLNAHRDLVRFPEQAVRAGQLHAMGLIDELCHLLCERYRRTVAPEAFAGALAHLQAELGEDAVRGLLARFTDLFPPLSVHSGAETVEQYLAGSTNGVPHAQIALEELLMLWLENANPAFAPFHELFDDSELDRAAPLRTAIQALEEYFEALPPATPDGKPLVAALRAPALAAPHSLTAQLDYIRTHWAFALSDAILRILSTLDFIKEEEKPIFFGSGPTAVPAYRPGAVGTVAAGYDEPEAFSPDRDWMPRAVLIAKNTYVWLDQLSRQYGRPIHRLDQVPDEELDLLARRGFTGLWLIGLWERSRASQRIKQLCGNPEAVASAYSLLSYEIAEDLGGWEALANLRERAMQRGIRLASDMVPNHMGIDSRWVIEHPDWFLQLDYSPYPSYSFTGPDLSSDERVAIRIEDHYYSRSDAAVVFQRVDKWTGDCRYIYHGNDGTNMPWNDTAQLNFLLPEVREAVIQTILHVARNFRIIRFDAAMTLAKRHLQRLWFPEPGTGGAIPTRAEHGLTRQQFDQAMPNEFWREVVDRVAAEVPDTLLLAEAFWLMEGYFVRTLGMHRVYNSAFMNLLRDEDNAKYRWVMKNTLEFDPEVLKRFVNFQNNPDEDTAVDQFGKGDKYFGICTMMCTLPGLPMFGHGQVEGFAEKYGMEYRRAFWDEKPDEGLVAHHERVIFPLLHRRRLFAEVRDFLLYDVWTPEGHVNEDVFAYSNRHGDERALVVFHNRFAEARGWIHRSVGYAVKDEEGNKRFQQRTLGQGLGIPSDPSMYLVFRDHVSGLEYLRNCRDLCERGLFVELGAYDYRVYLDFRLLRENEWSHLGQLAQTLEGRGVPSIEAALQDLLIRPVQQRLRELLVGALGEKPDLTGLEPLLQAVRDYTGVPGPVEPLAEELRSRWLTAREETLSGLGEPALARGVLAAWLALHALGALVTETAVPETSRAWMDEWRLGQVVAGVLMARGLNEQAADFGAALVRALVARQAWPLLLKENLGAALTNLLSDADVQRVIGVNRHQGVLWYNQEAFDELLGWMGLLSRVQSLGETASVNAALRQLRAASHASGFQVERLLAAFE